MRLFIAINFSEETRARLLALRDELHSRSLRGRFSLPENLHLTLAFLGECDARQRDDAIDAMDATGFEPFPVTVERVGRFRRDGGDIWWAGVSGSQPLSALQRGLTDVLIGAGFELDRRKYSPHITLGREVVTDAAPWNIEPFGEQAGKIELMVSDRVDGRLTYTAIHEKRADQTQA